MIVWVICSGYSRSDLHFILRVRVRLRIRAGLGLGLRLQQSEGERCDLIINLGSLQKRKHVHK